MEQVGILLILVLLSVSHAHVDQEPARISRYVLAAFKFGHVSCVLSNFNY